MDDNKRKLYDALSQDYDLGTYEQFESDIADAGKRRKLYDATIEEYDFGDFSAFEKQLGFGGEAQVVGLTPEPNVVKHDKPIGSEPLDMRGGENGYTFTAEELGIEEPKGEPEELQGSFNIAKPTMRNIPDYSMPSEDHSVELIRDPFLREAKSVRKQIADKERDIKSRGVASEADKEELKQLKDAEANAIYQSEHANAVDGNPFGEFGEFVQAAWDVLRYKDDGTYNALGALVQGIENTAATWTAPVYKGLEAVGADEIAEAGLQGVENIQQRNVRVGDSTLNQIMSSAGSMVADLPFFGMFGKVASFGSRAVGRKVVEGAIKREAAKQVAKGATEEAAKRYATYAVQEGLKNRLMTTLTTSAVQSGLTFGLFDVAKEAAHSTLTGDWDAEKLAKSFVGGTLMGAALGGTNATGSYLTRNLTGAKKVAGKVGEFAVENAVFTEGGRLIGEWKGEEPSQNSWLEDYLVGGATLGVIKLPGVIKNIRGIKANEEAKSVYSFTEKERELLTKNGEELTAVLEEMLPKGEKMTVEGEKVSLDGVNEGVLTEQYVAAMNNPEIPLVTKAKLMAVVEGKVMPAPRVTTVNIEGNAVKTYDPMGRLVETKEFKTAEEAKAEYKKATQAAEIEGISFLEDMYVRIKGYQADDVTVKEWLAKNPDVKAEDIANIIAKDNIGEPLTKAEQKILDSLREARREGLNDVAHLNEILAGLEQMGISAKDVITGIEKPASERTEAENKAVNAYRNALMTEVEPYFEGHKAKPAAEDPGTAIVLRSRESDARIDETANNGVVYTTTLSKTGEKIIITGGKVVLDNEGYIDVNQSEGLVAMFPDGQKKPVRPGDLREKVEVSNAEEMKAVKREEIRQEVAAENGWIELVPGNEYEVVLGGEPRMVKVEGRDERGDVVISMNGEAHPIAEQFLQIAIKEAEALRNGEAKAESGVVEAPVEVKVEKTENGEKVVAETAQPQEVAPVNGDNVSPVAAQGEMANVKAESEVAPKTALEQIPRNEKNVPLYEQVDSELAWDGVVEEAGGNEETAMVAVNSMVADKQDALKKAEKAKAKTGVTITEKIAAENERVANIEKAKADLAKWEEIAGVKAKRVLAAEAESKRVADEAAAKLKAEEERLRAEREAAERAEREALNGVPDMVDDKPQDARARGYRRVNGYKVDRQEPVQGLMGKEIAVKFSDSSIPTGRVAVIEAEQLQPSHIQGQRNPLHFIDEAQPKERNDAASVLSARKIAENVRPEEITSSVTAYTGAPTVNTRGEAVQGNNRSAALRLMWENNPEQAAKYKQYLIDHAAEFGLNAEEIAAMKSPVLVNMLDVSDADAITLGQYVAQDTESGGTERIKPKNVMQKMGGDMRSFANKLLASNNEEASFAELVDANGVEVLKWMAQKGYITPTQYKSAFDSKGNLTAEVKNDLRDVMYQSIFKGGSTQLEEMFNALPAKAQKAILATAFRDYDSPSAERMNGEVQNSIRAYYALARDAAFANAKNYKEAKEAAMMWARQYQLDDVSGESFLPSENFSNFAIELAVKFKGETQKTLQNLFNNIYDLIQGTKQASIFEEADNTPRTLKEAIKETFNIDYNGQYDSNSLAGGNKAGQPGRQGTAGSAATGERIEGGERPADSTGGTRGNGEVKPTVSQTSDNVAEGGNAPGMKRIPTTLQEIGNVVVERANEKQEERRRVPLRTRAQEWTGKLGVPIKMHESVETVTNNKAKERLKSGDVIDAWFNVNTGEVEMYLPYVMDVAQVDKLYLHEVVGHKGLREVMGEKFDTLCDNVWGTMSESKREHFLDYIGAVDEFGVVLESPSQKQMRDAADEYMAWLAENVDYETNKELWQPLIDSVREFFESLGMGAAEGEKGVSPFVMSDADIVDLIKASYANLANLASKASVSEPVEGDSGDEVSQVAGPGETMARKKGGKNKSSLNSAAPGKPVNATAKLDELFAKIDKLKQTYNSRTSKKTRGFITDIARELDLTKDESSHYRTFPTELGDITLRVSNHNSKLKEFEDRHEDEGVSIIISAKKNKKIDRRDSTGKSHVDEFFYPKQSLERSQGRPLVQILESIEDFLTTGVYVDKTGIAQPEDSRGIRFRKVFHGSGAKFDKFDHSFMGTGEGAQAFGWGTYVTEVEGIGKQYAKATSKPNFTYKGQEVDVEGFENPWRIIQDLYNEHRGKLRDMRKAADYYSDLAVFNDAKTKDLWQNVVNTLADIRAGDLKMTPSRVLYTVEIPDDNGSNYLHWEEVVPSNVVNAVKQRLFDELAKGDYKGVEKELKRELDDVFKYSDSEGYSLYGNISAYLGGGKAASRFLNEMGFVGISYPADGGRAGNKRNYVIFNEDDAVIEDRTMFRRANKNQEVFVSNAQRAVEGIKQEKATPEQWIAMLKKNGGLKAGEEAWLGLEEWLNEKQGAVTKQEILDFIGANKIQIEEVNYANASEMEDFRIPLEKSHGKDFADKFIKAFDIEYGEFGIYDEQEAVDLYNEANGADMQYDEDSYDVGAIVDWAEGIMKEVRGDVREIYHTRLDYTTDGLNNKREIALTVPTVESYNIGDYTHFGDAGNGRAVAWVRFGETTDSEGNRVLVIDEIQSKRHQDAREKGYVTEDYIYAKRERDYLYKKMYEKGLTEEEHERYKWLQQYTADNFGVVPSAPFEKNWHELAMKRMLRLAAEEGFDKVAWTTGEQQAERYNLGAVLKGLKAYKTSANEYYVIPYNNGVIDEFVKEYTEQELADTFGKELAQKIITNAENATEENPYEIESEELRVGGEGMKGFYDKMLPSFVQKYTKKWGAKVGEVTMPNLGENNTMHYVDVTPEMQESVMEGQTMFRFIGKKGAENLDKAEEATTRLDNLGVAREMETAGKDAKAIKLATGWERGADRKWRYETDDVKVNRAAKLYNLETRESFPIARSIEIGRVDDNSTIRLTDLVKDDELFKAYPEMEEYFVSFEKMDAGIKGSHSFEEKMIRINKDDIHSLESTLVHEIQHAIQSIEGFAKGGNTSSSNGLIQEVLKTLHVDSENAAPSLSEVVGAIENGYITRSQHEELVKIAQSHGYDDAVEYVRSLSPYSYYRRLAGEAESRNVQERMGMSPEQRRNKLAEETEDVRREDQIFIEENLGVSASQEVAPEQDIPLDEVKSQPLTSFKDLVTNKVLETSAKNKEDYELRASALQTYSRNLEALVKRVMGKQKRYDKATVNELVKLAKMYFKHAQLLGEISPYQVGRMMAALNDAVGKEDITDNANKLIGILVDAHNTALDDMLEKASKTKAKKVNASGVEVIGKLDKEGQIVLEEYNNSKVLDLETIEDKISVLEDEAAEASGKLEGENGEVERETAAKIRGLEMAKRFREDILQRQQDIKGMRDELRKAEKEMSKEAFDEFRRATERTIVETKLEMVDAYHDLIHAMSGDISSSAKRAKLFQQQQIDHVKEIQHNANSDLLGHPAETQGDTPDKWNSAVPRIFMSAMPTFQTMLKFFGEKAADGRGYLYERFMPQVTQASHNEFVGKMEAREKMRDKLTEIFGKKTSIEDFMGMSRKDGAVVEYQEGGEKKAINLTKGQVLYLYMVNKMADGQMKLSRMGITDADVQKMANELPEEFIKFADWVQEDLLTELRGKYNAVHERMFGAPMAAIENYFPIKINKRSRGIKVEPGMNTEDRPSTITGSVIKRTKNSIAVDLSADAMQVLLGHIDDMENWAAYAEVRRDVKSLLNYRHFQNQVMGMKSLRFGSGEKMWDNFVDVANIAVGSYKPSNNPRDKAVRNIAKGVVSSKIAFRYFTALKQILSLPAFWSEADVDNLMFCYMNQKGSWDWAMDNLPGFSKRWKGRAAGNEILLESDKDWKVWKNRMVEWLSKEGMRANAFIDALTVATGARAVYMTKYDMFKKAGYSEERAKEKALQRAAEAYNESQQSSEGAYLSPLQAEATVLSSILTAYRNSPFGYNRKVATAIANLRKKMRKGFKQESIDFMTKQLMRDGMNEEQAKRFAKSTYRRSVARDAADFALYEFFLNGLWVLGPALIYILGGDDEEKKIELLKGAALDGVMGGVANLPAGEMLSGVIEATMTGDYSQVKMPQLVATQDLENIADLMEYDYVRAANEVLNILVATGTGVNPQTFTDLFVALSDVEDFTDPRELAMLAARAINAPNSQLEQLDVDKAMEEYGKNAEGVVRRYAEYRKKKLTPLSGWMYGDEDEQKVMERYEKRFKRYLDERLEAVVENTAEYEDFYNNADPLMRAKLSKLRKAYLEGDKKVTFERLEAEELVKKTLYGAGYDDINTVYYELSNAQDEDMELMIDEKLKELKPVYEERKTKGKEFYELHKREIELYGELMGWKNAANGSKRAMKDDPERAQRYMNEIREYRTRAIDLINNYNE